MKTQRPLISVIIPVYNGEAHLKKCLDSVCQQAYSELEIICVNDGSTDSSGEILAEYEAKDKRIKVLTQQNAGQSAARNAGLAIATGTWITGFDCDDILELDAYAYCIRHISQHPDVKLVVFNYDSQDGDTGEILRNVRMPVQGLVVPTPEILYDTDCYFWNKLWHRDLFKLPGSRFPEGMWFEDVVLFYRIAPYLQSILYLPAVKAHYMRYDNFESSMDKARALPHKNNERILAVDLAMQHYAEHPLPPTMHRLAPGLLLYFYKQLRSFLAIDTEEAAWNLLRGIIEKHRLLPSICNTPELALSYYLPPCILNMHCQHFASMHDFELLLIANRLKKRYHFLRFRLLFSWGQSRSKLKCEIMNIKKHLRLLSFKTKLALIKMGY